RYSDDGEPSGTAGMPVLDVIVKNEIYDVCVVVTRYFGGVLLGTGGLVRAYSQGSKIALESGGIVLMQSCSLCEVSCSYNRYGKVSSLVMENGATIDDTIYESDVKIKFHIPPEQLSQLNKKLADATSGEVQAESDGESYFMTPLNS
ncbi:MAG: YigZ family protein, partial [Ruminococcus sp.]|nr:YigZ family protein [Ruminococcus sp.]